MHTAQQTADRRLNPRRLVPRRSTAHPRANDARKTAVYLEEIFHAEQDPPFQVGDLITFRKADRTVSSVMILEMRGIEVQAIFKTECRTASSAR